MRASSAMVRRRQTKRISRMCRKLNRNFYTKVIQNDFARLESETTANESEAVHTFDKFTGKAVDSGTGRRECHAVGVREYSSPSG